MTRACLATLVIETPVVGLRRLGHALRRLPAARPPARRLRARRRRRRGAPPDRHRAAPSRCTSRGTRSTTTPRCARTIEARGLRVGAVNPNLFQDPDYKLGSVTHPDAARAREGGRRTCSSASRSRRALGSTAQSLWLADGTNYPGQDDLRARRRAAARRASAQVYAALPAGAGAAGRVQALRARVLRDRPGRLGRGAADVPEARRPREGAGRPRPPRAGHEHRADRRAAGRRGPARRLPLQQPQVRRRRPDRRLGQPVRAVPDLLRAGAPADGCRG